MLSIDHPARTIPKKEFFDNKTQEFITIEEQYLDAVHLQLEHSLMSIAKWEARWHVSFIGRGRLSGEELLDYIRCMTINPVKNPKVYDQLTYEDLKKIVQYMEDPNSAWPIVHKNQSKSKASDTVETFYYAMIQYGVPLDCEKWHFNRLVAFLDFCGSQSGGKNKKGAPAKQNRREILEMYRAINERNRKRFNSKG